MTKLLKETFSGKIEVFPDGWFYVKVPTQNSQSYAKFAQTGNIKIKAQINDSTWNTLLWAFGNGTYFITLPVKIRKKEKIEEGNNIKISFGSRDE